MVAAEMAGAETRRQYEFGVFLPIAKGGFIISQATPKIDASYALNKRVSLLAEELGLDFVMSMAKWRGYGGPTDHWGASLESMVLMAALAEATKRVKIWCTVHTLLHHPAVVAKMMATLDHVSNGRAGMNIVAGAYQGEFEQMGMWRHDLDHDQRYELSREWIDAITRLWTERRVDFHGKYFNLTDCVCDPKPMRKPRPELICAGMSEAGMRFTVDHADAMFLAGRDEAELAATSRRAKQIAAENGKTIKTFAMYNLVPAETDRAANQRVADYVAGADVEAINGMIASYGLKPDGRESAFVKRSREGFMCSRIAGTDESIAQQVEAIIRRADYDGMMLMFPDFIDDLDFFGRRILPKLRARLGEEVTGAMA
jgi:pyrimidine oxygenase